VSGAERELDLLDELLAIVEGTSATAIDVIGDGFAVRIRRRPSRVASPGRHTPGERKAPRGSDAVRVRSPAVGIFSTEREWKVGDRVERGAVLGGVQSLGQVAEIEAPVSGAIREVLTASGAPVEYGQALFAIETA